MFFPEIANVNVVLQMSWTWCLFCQREKQAKFVNLKSAIIQGLHPTTCFRQDKEFGAKLNSDLAALGTGLRSESFDCVHLSTKLDMSFAI